MSDHDLPELDDELRDLFAAERTRPEPSPDVAARVLARVSGTVLSDAPSDPAPESPSELAPPTPVAETAVAVGLSKSALGLVLVSFGVGTALGALGHAKLAAPVVTTRVEIREVVREVRVPVPMPSEPVVVASPAADAGAAHATDAGHVRDAGFADAAQNAQDAGEQSETGRDLGLADENALVTRAQTALARGRAGEALEALSEHQRRFPRGQFTEEREALAIQALARLGRTEQATARAERFRARYPGSLMMRVVDAALRTP